MIKNISIIPVLAGFVLLMFSCSGDTLFDDQLSLNNQTWESDMAASFEFQVEDTTKYYDLYLSLRNTEDYPYSNIYLFTTLHFPNNKIAIDTVECRLADKSGKWYGSGIGGIFENKILFSRNKAFPLKGTYRMEINHAMREDNLEGISDVGFGVEVHED